MAVEFFKQQLRQHRANEQNRAPEELRVKTVAPPRRGTDAPPQAPAVNPAAFRRTGGPAQYAPLPPPQGATVPPSQDGVEPIVYTRTRSVDAPLSALKERRVLTVLGEGALANAYRTLGAQILNQMRDRQWSVLGVTSPGRGEGKTLTALNLAISLAMESQFTVLLVDGNVHEPGLLELFGLPAARGLSDHLLHDTPIDELLIHPGIRRLTVLPAGQRLINPAELLSSPKMRALAAEFKQRYASRVIVYDLPSLQRAADVLAVSPCLDAMLLVVEAGRTTREEAERAAQLLTGVPLVGTLLNKG